MHGIKSLFFVDKIFVEIVYNYAKVLSLLLYLVW